MNISNSAGESSSKRQENGDAPSGSERPLKKARFAWQVKGKYHLKNDNNDTSTSLSRETEATEPTPEIESASENLVGSAEQNLEILGDYLLKQDFNTLDSVIADSEKSLLKPSGSIPTESLPYPRYVSSNDNNNLISHRALSSDEHISIPMSMVVTQRYSEEQCIARWQARQMAKGFVDNTINRVLDSWSRPPTVPDIPPQPDLRPLQPNVPPPQPNMPPHQPNIDESRFLALDLAEFINNLPGDNSVENEGILMAISAHGLQNTSTSNSSTSTSGQTDHNSTDQEAKNVAPASREDWFLSSPPTSPILSDDEELEELILKPNDPGYRPPKPKKVWPYAEALENEDNNDGDDPPLDEQSIREYLNEIDRSSPDHEYSVSGINYEFMDTAISFAILNKGLTTFGNDYG